MERGATAMGYAKSSSSQDARRLVGRRAARRRGVGRRSGQALLEMAAVVVVLLPLSLGIIQYGIIYSTAIQLTNLARDGARFAAIHGTEATVRAQVADYVQDHAVGTTIAKADIPDSAIAVTYPSQTSGSPITVTITYNMTRKFFLPNAAWIGLSRNSTNWTNFRQQATMTIE